MKKFCLSLFVLGAAALESSEQLLVNGILNDVKVHSKTNSKFAELEAGTRIAMKGEQTASGRSPIAEVAAMTDMMLIQIAHEIDHIVVEHTVYDANCKKNNAEWSVTINAQRQFEKDETVSIAELETSWRDRTENVEDGVPSFQPKMDEKDRQMRKNMDEMAAASAKRKAQHLAFLKTVKEHDGALADIKVIRLLIQNSQLDNKANVGKTVSAGEKTAAVTTNKAFLELKTTVHPKLLALVELSHQAVSSSSGIDKIYSLLYATRDSLLASKAKLIKGEMASNSNWRTNKIAFRNDYADLMILKQTYYQQLGTLKKKIGETKKEQGIHMITRAGQVKIAEDFEIQRAFLKTACNEEQNIYSSNLATKKNEKKSLEAVQAKLVSLKWSNKVYASIQKVSEGVTYLNGEYNIRSRLNRYMINVAGTPRFQPFNKVRTAGKFTFHMNADDLSYNIVSIDKSGKVPQMSFLTESNNNVEFMRAESKKSRWNVIYDVASNSMFIRNQVTRNTLYVDAKDAYKITTADQTIDARSQFFVEKPEYSRVGCYKNKINKQLETYAGADNKMNTNACFEKCKATKKDFAYFGLSEGQQCFCGKTWWQEKAPASDCGYVCNQRDGDLCGGKMRTLIYKNTEKVDKPIMIEKAPKSAEK